MDFEKEGKYYFNNNNNHKSNHNNNHRKVNIAASLCFKDSRQKIFL